MPSFSSGYYYKAVFWADLLEASFPGQSLLLSTNDKFILSKRSLIATCTIFKYCRGIKTELVWCHNFTFV